MTHRRAAAVLAALTVSTVQAAPGERTAKSGASTAALVERYTSEGCDSCPRADRWLSGAPAAGFETARVVPFALHVDHWDSVGWKGPYAKPLFAARQCELAAIGRNRVVYTPQVVLAGRDFRAWPARRSLAEAVAAINATRARAAIELAIAAGGIRAQASVPRRENREDTALFVAVYENGLSNRVTAGENRGATLNHDFVVRERWGPLALDAAGSVSLASSVDAQPLANRGNAAFVQRRRTGEVLQALALPACKG